MASDAANDARASDVLNKAFPKPLLCLAFDGVIHSYTSGWALGENAEAMIGDPFVPGAMAFIKDALQHFKVAIYAQRSAYPRGLVAMQQRMLTEAMGEFPDDYHWVFGLLWPLTKPAAMVTIDDRAVTFTGQWPPMEELLAFRPWNKPGETRSSVRSYSNIDAPKYAELERRYLRALQMMLDMADTLRSDVERRANQIEEIFGEAAAKHPFRLELDAEGRPRKIDFLDGA